MKLRYYQVDCVKETMSSLKTQSRILNILPTGAGKTVIMNALLDEIGDECKETRDENILVLCHLKDIGIKNKLSYDDNGKHQATYMAGREYPSDQDIVVYSSMQSAASETRLNRMEERTRRRPAYIIIDEVHLFGCRSYDLIAERYPDAKIIGFTATPFRENKNSISLFDTVAYSISMEELQEGGYLADIDLKQFPIGNDTDETKVKIIHDICHEENQRGVAGIVMLPSVALAKYVYSCLQLTLRCSFMDGKTGEDKVREIVSDLQEGRSDILIVCKKGLVGLDCSRLKYAVIPYGVKSVVTFLQLAGRAVRPYQNQSASVYVFGDSPSIKRGKYEKMLRYTKGVKEDPENPQAMLQEELDFLLSDEDIKNRESKIEYLLDALHAVEYIERNKHVNMYSLVQKRKFPRKYSKAITAICSRMPAVEPSGRPITALQKTYLTDIGFDDCVDNLSDTEAASLIQAFINYFARSHWIIERGPHKGKHWNETPSMYRKFLKDPGLKSHFYAWIRAGRPRD